MGTVKRYLMIVASVILLSACLQAQTISLQLLPPSPVDKNFRVGGMAGFSVTGPPSDTVWVEDGVPPGAVTTAESDAWNWIASNPAPLSGGYAHQSNLLAGMHQHYFYWAANPLIVNGGDVLVTYLYLDPVNPPGEVMLQWNDSSWEHRAYWGADKLTWGTNKTSSRRYMGALPPTGQWVRLEVPASLVGLEGRVVNGMAFSLFDGRAAWDHAGKSSAPAPPPDTVWLEDGLPAGAVPTSESDAWNWVKTNPLPPSGDYAHRSNIAAGMHQHVFNNATQTLAIGAGDVLVTYVYLDPSNPPSEVMLQWNDGSWEHRAFWGANQITGWGVTGTNSRYQMGALPVTGQWVRLEVPASLVGLEGRTLKGMAFTLYGGRAAWDHSGKAEGYAADQYRLYATTSLPRGKWTSDGTAMSDYFLASLTGGTTDTDKCAVTQDPATWNARCIDTITLLTKNISCLSDNPTLACQNTAYWNAYPGRTNISTFPTRPPPDDKGFGWPSNNNWGVKGLIPVVTKDTVNRMQPSPPDTSANTHRCHPVNAQAHATGAANSKVTQVKFPDGTSRWFMAFNSQIHDEVDGNPQGYTGLDLWRVQWAYSDDGITWTAENRPLLMDITETFGDCSTGELVTDMFVDMDSATNTQYFYIVITRVLFDQVWLLRSPVKQSSAAGYDAAWGWEIRGAVEAGGNNRWIRIPPERLGTQIDFTAIGAEPILPTRFGSAYGGAVKQSSISRVFNSYRADSPSRYIALTVDKNGTAREILELWATESLNKPFVYQSDIDSPPFGGYGFEMAFTHYPDNSPATPRLFDNTLELWFVDAVPCEGLINCDPALPPGSAPNAPPAYRNQSLFTLSRRRARLSGDIYGQ